MRVLVLGAGGREHACVWKLAQEDNVEKIYASPGNAGIATEAELVELDRSDVDEAADFVREKDIDLTLAWDERYLEEGIVEEFAGRNLDVLGPELSLYRNFRNSLQARRFLLENDIPAVDCGIFSRKQNARRHLQEADYPLRIRGEAESASGESGEVIIASGPGDARRALDRFLDGGDGDDSVLIEEIPEGERVTVLALSDGSMLLPFSSARIQHHIFEGGEGPLTPGMGAYSPLPYVSFQQDRMIYGDIMMPLLEGLRSLAGERGYRGFLSADIVLTERGPRLLEFNPGLEGMAFQAVIPRLNSELSGLLARAAAGNIERRKLDWSQDSAVSIVISAGGYPLTHQEGREISGLEELQEEEDICLFHNATGFAGEKIVTAGGRVLAVTALASGHFTACDRAHEAVEKIDFADMHYRTDIGSGAVLDFSPEAGDEEERDQREGEE